jgi:hypothetical protein
MADEPKLLTIGEAARKTKIPGDTFALNYKRWGISYIRITGRVIRFRDCDLDMWLEDREKMATKYVEEERADGLLSPPPKELSQLQGLIEHRPEKCCGVYFLVRDDKTVYVGESVSILSRVNQHRDKDFNRVFYIQAGEDRHDIEEYFIGKLKPEYNGGIQ